MTKKGIVTKTAGVLVAMVLTVMFALPTFAAGYSPVSGSAGDTSFSGRVYINWNGAPMCWSCWAWSRRLVQNSP